MPGLQVQTKIVGENYRGAQPHQAGFIQAQLFDHVFKLNYLTNLFFTCCSADTKSTRDGDASFKHSSVDNAIVNFFNRATLS